MVRRCLQHRALYCRNCYKILTLSHLVGKARHNQILGPDLEKTALKLMRAPTLSVADLED